MPAITFTQSSTPYYINPNLSTHRSHNNILNYNPLCPPTNLISTILDIIISKTTPTEITTESIIIDEVTGEIITLPQNTITYNPFTCAFTYFSPEQTINGYEFDEVTKTFNYSQLFHWLIEIIDDSFQTTINY